jgi:hypothetical protein
MKKTTTYALGAAGVLAVSLIQASAIPTDYALVPATPTATINGAIYTITLAQSTGTGVIDPFVRVQDNGIADGYNSSVRPVMPDVNTSPTFTHDLLLSAVPILNIGGTDYYEFLLDINQTAANPLLSLDKIEIYTRASALTSADELADLTGAGSTLRYSLDTALVDNRLVLDYRLNNGSGTGDMLAYIPKSLFGSETDYLYLYSSFGSAPNEENDGFEEWAVKTRTTPPPGVPDAGASLALLGMGIMGVGFVRRKLA